MIEFDIPALTCLNLLVRTWFVTHFSSLLLIFSHYNTNSRNVTFLIMFPNLWLTVTLMYILKPVGGSNAPKVHWPVPQKNKQDV